LQWKVLFSVRSGGEWSKSISTRDAEHHTLALSTQGPQGRQALKLLCLTSQEITVFSASAEQSFVCLPYLLLIAKES